MRSPLNSLLGLLFKNNTILVPACIHYCIHPCIHYSHLHGRFTNLAHLNILPGAFQISLKRMMSTVNTLAQEGIISPIKHAKDTA